MTAFRRDIMLSSNRRITSVQGLMQNIGSRSWSCLRSLFLPVYYSVMTFLSEGLIFSRQNGFWWQISRNTRERQWYKWENAVKTLPIHNMAPNINEAILLNIDVQYFALPLSVSPASFLHFHSAYFLPICKNQMHNTLDVFPANPKKRKYRLTGRHSLFCEP